MVTQLLFGDHYTVLEQGDGWMKITTAFDNYDCWISAKQHTKISPLTFERLNGQPAIYAAELIYPVYNKETNSSFPIVAGSRLPLYKDGHLQIEQHEFTFDGRTSNMADKKNATELLNTAFTYLNAPYLWGGKSPLGIDCSGFTQTVFKLNGYQLPRDAYQQVELGVPLSFVEEAQAGDLAFFDNEEGKITHVGILLDHEKIIHASGLVKIEKFDHYGIYSNSLRKYSHTLRVIKRLLD